MEAKCFGMSFAVQVYPVVGSVAHEIRYVIEIVEPLTFHLARLAHTILYRSVSNQTRWALEQMSHESPIQQRLRITFGKSGTLKYTSSLDIAKIWERVLRRADLPILYTQGFNTRPRIQLAMPLPLGITSECEMLDVALREPIELDETKLIPFLLSVSPVGLDIHKIEEIETWSSTMQSLVLSAEYRLRFEDGIDPDVLQQKVDDILNRDKIIVEKVRKRKRSIIDLRPLIIDLSIDDHNDLLAHLSVGERGNMRPDQLIEQMGLADEYISVHRYKLHTLAP